VIGTGSAGIRSPRAAKLVAYGEWCGTSHSHSSGDGVYKVYSRINRGLHVALNDAPVKVDYDHRVGCEHRKLHPRRLDDDQPVFRIPTRDVAT